MKVPYTWLKDYVDIDAPPKEIARILSLIGHALDKPIEKIGDDWLLDFEDRGNRADAMGILGLARDLAAFSGEQFQEPPLARLPEIDNKKFVPQIKVETDKVIRFLAVTFQNIKIGPSKAEIAQKIKAYGLEPINNVVDLTNFVMIELGMPLHAFDQDRVSKLVLRKARQKETLTTFEGTKVELSDEDLVAADETGPLTLTTAVGGRQSGISAKTKNVLVEAGLYDQPTARRSALRHKITNETALRLGKYLHPNYCHLALARFTYLMKKLYGHEPNPVSFDYYPEKFQKEYAPKTIELSSERLDLIAGEEINLKDASKILEKLGFTPKTGITPQKGVIPFEVPFFRTDVSMEDDLIEEVLRIRGFDKLPAFLPERPSPPKLSFPLLDLEDRLRGIAVRLGFNEVISQQIIDVEENRRTGFNEAERIIHLENPINADLTILRPQLLSGSLKYARHYQKHGLWPVKIFEIGKTYSQDLSKKGYEKYQETHKITLTKTGDYLDLKADVEALLKELGIKDYKFKKLDYLFKKSRAASIWVDDDGLGKMGEVKTSVLVKFGLEDPVTHAVFYTGKLIKYVKADNANQIRTDLINYISEDFTFSLGAKEEVGPFLAALKLKLSASTEVIFKGIYQDAKMKREGRKSLTINARFLARQAQDAKRDSASLHDLTAKS